jgi:hypothetical protein
MKKRTLELTQDEINLILRALLMAERTFDTFRRDYITKTNDGTSYDSAPTDTSQIGYNATKCFDLRFAITKGQKYAKK